MKRKSALPRIFVVIALGVLLSIGAGESLAAAKRQDPPPEAVPSPVEKNEAVNPEAGPNAEKLLYTLNETLQENRKIRQSMRDLQTAFEKVTIEKSDMADQIRKVEQMAIQRNKEIGARNDDLDAQLNTSKQEIEKLQAENKASAEKKMELEKKIEAISAESAQTQELLKNAILGSERDLIVERMKKNDSAVQEAMTQISSVNGENIALKQQLIQSYFDLGNMFYDLGRYEDAAVQYLNVLAWDPNHAWGHHNLAVIYDYHMHKVHKAIEHYKQYMHLKLASEEAGEARMRLWDLQQLTKLEPAEPLKEDFKKFRKI